MGEDRETFIVTEGGKCSIAVRYHKTFHYEAEAAAAACSEISDIWLQHMFPEGFGYALRIGMAEFPHHSDEKRNIKIFYFTMPIFVNGFEPTEEDIDTLYNSITEKALEIMKCMTGACDCDISAVILNPPAEMLASLDAFLDSP